MTGYVVSDPMWDDLRFPVASINPVGLAAPPTLNQTNGLLEFSATITNTVAIQVQMPHSWKEASTIVPHIHWRKKTQGTGNVYWRLTYEFVNRAAAFTDSPATANVTAVISSTPDDGTELVHLISSFGDVTMTGKEISCMGLLTLSRIGGDDLDTYAGVAQLLEFDIHFQSDGFGSIQQFAKQGSVLTDYGYGVTVNQ